MMSRIDLNGGVALVSDHVGDVGDIVHLNGVPGVADALLGVIVSSDMACKVAQAKLILWSNLLNPAPGS